MRIHPNLLDQLQVFVSVADSGSFNAAARQLGRAQSAVSYSIANLEEMLQVRLFERAGRRGGLSASGHNLLPQARQAIAAAERLLADAAQLAEGAEPLLRLLVDELFPLDRLAAALKTCQDDHRATRIRIDQAPMRDVVAGLVERDADVGFAMEYSITQGPGMETRPLGHVTMLPVAAPDHPLGRAEGPVGRDLAGRHRQIVLSERLSHDSEGEGGVFATETWRVGDMHIKYDLLLAGLGWGFMPAHLVEDDIEAGRLRRLRLDFTNELVLPLVAVWRRASPLGPVARDLVSRLGAAG